MFPTSRETGRPCGRDDDNFQRENQETWYKKVHNGHPNWLEQFLFPTYRETFRPWGRDDNNFQRYEFKKLGTKKCLTTIRMGWNNFVPDITRDGDVVTERST